MSPSINEQIQSIIEWLNRLVVETGMVYPCPYSEAYRKVSKGEMIANSLFFDTFTPENDPSKRTTPDGVHHLQPLTIYHVRASGQEFAIYPIMALENQTPPPPAQPVILGKIYGEITESRHTVLVPLPLFQNMLEWICEHLVEGGDLALIRFDSREQAAVVYSVEEPSPTSE